MGAERESGHVGRSQRVQKTNAMRELDRAGVPYRVHTYEPITGEHLGVRAAELIGVEPERSFKTLVTTTPSGGHVVCCIPAPAELDLKAAARVAGEKALEIAHTRDLVAEVGYERGACSPVGMRRRFPTIFDESCELYDAVCISGGRHGLTLEVPVADLVAFCAATVADICRKGASRS